jgi:hypothetical protein
MAAQVFVVPNAGGNALLTCLLLVPAALAAVLAVVFWPRPLRVEVTSQELKVSGSVYGRALARGDLELEDARAVDLNREPALIPVRRSNGVGLANYQVGWFRLKNGRRALCFLTRRDKVLYLPTKNNFVLLLSITEPEQLLAALGK